jgi:hypothetical protein
VYNQHTATCVCCFDTVQSSTDAYALIVVVIRAEVVYTSENRYASLSLAGATVLLLTF